MQHMGLNVALACQVGDLREWITSDSAVSMRGLISPVLRTAAALAGGVRVETGLKVSGSRAQGSLDWSLVCEGFNIVVVEVRASGAGG